MNKYSDFWTVVIGPGPTGFFFGFLVVAYVAGAVSLLLDASNRDIASTNTPVKFSWSFLWAANWKRIFANILAVPLLIRILYPNIGLEIMLITSVGVGAVIDRAAMWLKNLGVLASNKAANRVAQKLEPDQPIVVDKNNQTP